MASNSYNLNPNIAFMVPPPNYNVDNTGMKPGWQQNWKSHQSSNNNYQTSSTRLPKVNYNSHTVINEQLTQPGTSHGSIANNSSNMKKSQITNNIKNKQIKSSDRQLMPPPPPPPPFVLKPKNSVSNTVTNYYMTNTQTVYQPNRYTTNNVPYPSPPLPYTAVGGNMYATNLASYYTSPPPVTKDHTQHPPSNPPFHYPKPTHHGYTRNNYYKHKGDSSQDSHRNYYKRRSDTDFDAQRKGNKKRKKPLSQNIPQRKDWSVDEAKKAIEIEKEYNKRNRSQSLIIKFPDTELNRDIVSRFHPAIDNVHFQQPSTPRFCFVTLKDGNNSDDIIEHLNRTPFGHGFVTAEYKKDREDEMNIGPEDIDPLTLYVGNLAQDVIQEDMVKIYPKHKRIDISYAKKMKYTRYAFVSFKTVENAIEAFKQTHATQLYSKRLIVRFRRLHGTVGMPGEPKPQVSSRNESYSPLEDLVDSHNQVEDTELAPWEMVDVSNWRSVSQSIKNELTDSCSEDEMEDRKLLSYSNSNNSDMFNCSFVLPEPMHIKKEEITDEGWTGSVSKSEIVNHDIHLEQKVEVSHQPFTNKIEPSDNELTRTDIKKIIVPNLSSVKEEPDEKKVSTDNQLFNLHNSVNNSTKKVINDVKVKKEVLDSFSESTVITKEEKENESVNSFSENTATVTIGVNTDNVGGSSVLNTEVKKVNMPTIKSEFYDDDISNDGDGDNSSEDELDFNNILAKIKQKKSKLKKFRDMLV